MRVRGFTLIEMLGALAISGIVLAGVISGVAGIQQGIVQTKRVSRIHGDSKVLAEFMSSQLHGVGGGSLRPWAAVFRNTVGDDDQLTVLHTVVGLAECGVLAHTGTASGQTVAFDATGGCCFTDAEWGQREVMLLNAVGNAWQSVKVSSASEATCELTFTNGFANAHNNFAASTSFNGGVAVVVEPKRFARDATTNILEVTHLDDTFTQVTRPMAPNVYSMQVALGFDFNPEDGRVTQSMSTSDEWLGNAVGDAITPDAADMRRVAVGFVIGAAAPRGQNARVLDGPTITENGIYMNAVRTQITFRNLFIFQ